MVRRVGVQRRRRRRRRRQVPAHAQQSCATKIRAHMPATNRSLQLEVAVEVEVAAESKTVEEEAVEMLGMGHGKASRAMESRA